VSKYYCSELAQRIAEWSALRVPNCGPILEAAFREAPGVTMAGGTSNMMLQIISSLALDDYVFEEVPV
jgi:hypothetical protein